MARQAIREFRALSYACHIGTTGADPKSVEWNEKMADDFSRSLIQFNKRIRALAYVSSWCMGENESEAMWRIYGSSGASVALVTSYGRLRDSLPNDNSLYVGTINYFDFERRVVDLGNTLWPLMHKRHEFEHESEARIVRCDLNMPPEANLDELPPVHFLHWKPEDHVEKIVVSPYTPAWQSETIKESLRRISPTLADRLMDSEMANIP